MKKDLKAAAQENLSQKARLDGLEAEKAGLPGDLRAIYSREAGLLGNVSDLTARLACLDSRIRVRIGERNKTCDGDAESCLEELVNNTEPILPSEPQCSPVKDGICPQNCAGDGL